MLILKSVPRLLAVAVLFIGFAGYSFMQASSVWTAPTGNPPTGNVDAPINEGTLSQMKDGSFVTGGTLGIANNRPTQKFMSTNATRPINDWYQFTESNGASHLPTMAFAYDRDDNGTYGNDYPVPLVLSVGATAAEDHAKFSSQVWASQYCNTNGTVCIGANDLVGSTTNRFGNISTFNFSGSKNTDTNVSSAAACVLTGMDTGGCDTGASCKINISGDSWVVTQVQHGDCNYDISCQYMCMGVPTVQTYTYLWQVSGYGNCSSMNADTCNSAEPGTQSREVTCVRSDGSIVADSFCPISKPATSQVCYTDRSQRGDCR